MACKLSKSELKKIPTFDHRKIPLYNQLEDLSLERTAVYYIFEHPKYNIIWLITHCDVKEKWFFGYAYGHQWGWMSFKFSIMQGATERNFALEEMIRMPSPVSTVLKHFGENDKREKEEKEKKKNN